MKRRRSCGDNARELRCEIELPSEVWKLVAEDVLQRVTIEYGCRLRANESTTESEWMFEAKQLVKLQRSTVLASKQADTVRCVTAMLDVLVKWRALCRAVMIACDASEAWIWMYGVYRCLKPGFDQNFDPTFVTPSHCRFAIQEYVTYHSGSYVGFRTAITSYSTPYDRLVWLERTNGDKTWHMLACVDDTRIRRLSGTITTLEVFEPQQKYGESMIDYEKRIRAAADVGQSMIPKINRVRRRFAFFLRTAYKKSGITKNSTARESNSDDSSRDSA